MRRPPDWFWRLFDVPGWAWALAVVVILYAVGVSDPHCCITGPYDDVVGATRW